jgi:hypothetical protein
MEIKVGVCGNVAEAVDLPPGDLGVTVLDGGRRPAGGLRERLEPSQNGVLDEGLVLERLPAPPAR